MTLNPNVHPHGGHWFQESDGTKIVGDGWAGVIARVKRYRERRGLPPGDPTQEVINQACQREPVICVHENPAYDNQLKRGNFKGSVLTWLSQAIIRRSRKELQFVEDAERQRRAQICATCPLNQEFNNDGCASCRAAVDESRKNLLGGKFKDARMKGCKVLGEDLQVATHLETVAEDNPELPGHCWRKRQ
jgi:hypothetical protein